VLLNTILFAQHDTFRLYTILLISVQKLHTIDGAHKKTLDRLANRENWSTIAAVFAAKKKVSANFQMAIRGLHDMLSRPRRQEEVVMLA